MLEESYVHLPLKIAMHAVNPVGRLKILRRRLDKFNKIEKGQELNFHKEMLEIFNSLKDLHTNYMLPKPFSDKYAVLPFLMEYYKENGQDKFIVTKAEIPYNIKELFPANFKPDLPDTFKPGVEITYWNGVPVKQAVEINANKNAGSNPAASFAQGLDSMTIRPMLFSLPPDEEWVTISYKTEDGQDLEYRQQWLVISRQPKNATMDTNSATFEENNKIGINLRTDLIGEMKQALFAPESLMNTEQRLTSAENMDDKITNTKDLNTRIPSVLNARKVSDNVGYIRLYTFAPRDPITTKQVFEEFVSLMLQLPKNGLIIDVRANGGGSIILAESILQLLTPKEITPEPYQFISSPLIFEMTNNKSNTDLNVWGPSLSESISTGSTFSQGFPITTINQANAIGQLYHGPVVLITDALCYSATDLFAAGFQDHKIGPIIGVDENTGAGGANVWEYNDLRKSLFGTKYELKALPSDSNMRVAIRRNVRVGDHSGTPVEDLGIIPDILYKMTRIDLLEKNSDLIKKASEILASMPLRKLDATLSNKNNSLQIEVDSIGISRIDLYVDDRPILSQDITDGVSKLIIDKSLPDSKQIEIVGLKYNQIVATRKIFL